MKRTFKKRRIIIENGTVENEMFSMPAPTCITLSKFYLNKG